MRVSARLTANRANAKRSTGPRSKEGRASSARNAYKHGLSIPARLLPECSQPVEAYVTQLIGDKASDEARSIALDFAEAQVDIDRVRQARLSLYEDENARTKKIPTVQRIKLAGQMLDLCERIEALPDDAEPAEPFRGALPALADFLQTFRISPKPPTLEVGMGVIASRLAKLWRYEHRALSRRDKAAKRLRSLF